MGGSPGHVSEEPVTWEKRKKIWTMSCDVELCSFINLSVASPTSQLILQLFCHFTYVTAHSPTLLLLHLRHSSFSNSSFASPTSQALHLRHLVSCPCCFSPFSLHIWPLTEPGTARIITEDQSIESFHVFMTFLIFLQTPRLHIEMVMYFMSYTNNRMYQIVNKYTGRAY